MPTFKTLAIVDDVHECGCCGKSNLKQTVAMEREDGEVVYFGTVCATRHSGRDAKTIRSEAAAVHEEKVKKARQEFNNSPEEVAYRAKLDEAYRNKIAPGRLFKEYCSEASECANSRRKEIAAKFGLSLNAF